MTMQPEQRRFSIRYSIVAMIGLLLIEAYLFAPHPETLAYSDFIKLVKAGTVSDVTLSNQAIGGTLAASAAAISVLVALVRGDERSSRPIMTLTSGVFTPGQEIVGSIPPGRCMPSHQT